MRSKRVALVLILLMVRTAVWAIDGLQVGMHAPEFSLHSLDGKTVSLSGLRESKLVVVTFFATWNERSPELLERLEKLFEKYRKDGLVVLGINVESLRIPPEEETAVGTLARGLGLNYPILIDRGLATFRSYGVVAVPSTVVVGPDGRIVGELSGYPLAQREGLFDLIESTLTGVNRPGAAVKVGYQPKPAAVRYFNLAKALAARGAVDMADADLKKSIEIDSRFVLPLVLLGQLLKERAATDEEVEFHGRNYTTAFFSPEERERYLAEARALFQKALDLEPGNVTARTERASLLVLKGQRKEAEDSLRKVLDLDPSYTPAHIRLGALLVGRGDLEGARRAFDTATKLNPLDARVYLAFAQAYEEKGMQKDALVLYKKGLELLWSNRKELFPLSFGR